MTDVTLPRNLPSATTLSTWRWIGLAGLIALPLLAVVNFLIKAEALRDGGVSYITVLMESFVLLGLAFAFAAIGIRSGHRHDRYYVRVSSGIVHELGQDSNGYLYIVLAGLNKAGIQTSQRVYFSDAMRWRSLSIGDSYSQG